jgi:hypothetical protein
VRPPQERGPGRSVPSPDLTATPTVDERVHQPTDALGERDHPRTWRPPSPQARRASRELDAIRARYEGGEAFTDSLLDGPVEVPVRTSDGTLYVTLAELRDLLDGAA